MGGRKYFQSERGPLAQIHFAVIVLAVACACSSTPLGSIALKAGQSLLRNVAEKNYEPEYVGTLGKMLDILAAQNAAPVAGAEVATTPLTSPTTPEPEATSAAQHASAGPIPIELEVAVLREVVLDGRPAPVPVADGDVLVDGFGGRATSGDNLKIRFESNTACHVYAVWIDATGWTTPIFPRSETYAHANPVEPGERYDLPEGHQWWYLDEFRGVETLYFVASHEPLLELERILEGLVGKRRALRPEVEEPTTVAATEEITRGLGGVRPSQVQGVLASDASLHDAPSQLFLAELPGSDLVITRWFRHE